MSFQIHIGLIGLSVAEAQEKTGRCSSGPHLRLTYDRHYRLFNSPTIAISDSLADTLADGLLSDNADWNAAHWELRSEHLDPLADLAEKWFLDSLNGITFFAGWSGDKPMPRAVSLYELTAIIRRNRLPMKTAFVLEKPMALL